MRFTKTIASASVAAVLGLAGVSVAGATSSSGSSKPTATAAAAPAKTEALNARPGSLRRRIRRHAAAIVAKTIGITPAELTQELRAGKTIATVATEHGVQPQAVIDALKVAATARINAAEAAHKISAARAARLQQRLDPALPE